MRRMPLGPIEAFVAAARSGSLARAAVAMNLTVPALSRRIRLLEATLGVSLFRREARGLSLTEAGRAYLAEAGPAWERLELATEAARARGQGGPIRVSAMPSFAAAWLAPRLARLHAAWPRLSVQIEASSDPVDLAVRTDLDCAIRLGRGPWPGSTSRPLLAVDAFPVCSPSFAAAGLTRPGDLVGQPLIGTHHSPDFWREWFAAADLDVVVGQRHSFDNLQVVYEAAAAGLGIALGLGPVVRPYLDGGRLKPLGLAPVRLSRQFHLVVRAGAARSDRAFTAFRDWLAAEASIAPG
jgi:LysR family glycine cleavage system transcriptional activator